MKKGINVFLLLFLTGLALGQKHDYIWVTGDSNNPLDTTKGGTVIDFHQHPPLVYYRYRELNFRTCNTSMCDTAGNLMFYSNGCAIAGADDQILDNGDDINPGSVHTQHCGQYNWYNSGYQSEIILPQPGSTDCYYLFHKRLIVTFNPYDVKSDILYYSVVRMTENNGTGKVTKKNVELLNGSVSIGELTAVKHANGKDWWVITPKRNSNEFYCFLFTKDGIVDTLVQTIGDAPRAQAEGGIQVVFSPDGSRFFRSIPSGPVMMYGFDRSNGLFTSYDTIHIDYKNWPSIANGCAISPNGRFFYVCAELNIFQFDLLAADISASQVTVAEWDGFKDPVGTIFGKSQLGPDCKIYVSTIDSRYYHVINNPDEPGLACNVTQHSFHFPTPTGASIPSFPNFRLGPIDNPGVPCTATVSVNSPPALPERTVLVYPNPANDEVNIKYYFAAEGKKSFRLFNAYGQAVREIDLNQASGKISVPVRDLNAGVYWYKISSVNDASISGKLMLAH